MSEIRLKCQESKLSSAISRMVNKRFGHLIVTSFVRRNKNQYLWECQCDCGNTTTVISGSLNGGATKSCGCYRNKQIANANSIDITNKKYGKLKAIKQFDKKGGILRWLCECDCGRFTIVRTGDLQQNKTKTCGNCQLKRRGVTTSYKALELQKQLSHKGVHNYKTKDKLSIDIAFVKNGKKIAIEYDEWYWHKNKLDKDKKKHRKLLSQGWKLLRIKAHDNLPDTETLNKAIEALAFSSRKQYTITLKGWGI